MLAGLALAGSLGPATLSLTATGAAFGARRGFGYMTGINVGMFAVMVITASGVVGLLLAVPGATPVVSVLAGAYFLYLAYQIATAPPLSDASAEQSPPSLAAGVLLSLINPKGYAAMAALFSGFVLVRERVALDATVKLLVLRRDHRGGQPRLAHQRRRAHALLPRSGHEPRHQRHIRDPADRLGGCGA